MEIWEWNFWGWGRESGSQFRFQIKKNQLQKSAGNTAIYLSFCLCVQGQIGLGFEETGLAAGLELKYPWGPLQPKYSVVLCGLFTGDRCKADPYWEGKEKEIAARVTAKPFAKTHSTTAPCADVIPNMFPPKKKSGNLYPKAAENPDLKMLDTSVGSTFSILQRQTKSCLTSPCRGRSPPS